MNTKTNKELGIINGQLGSIVSATSNRFVVAINDSSNKNQVTGDSNQERDHSDNNSNQHIVAFNPTQYSGFKHGYATTVFKAQGASIADVYVYHDGFSTIRNSYVSLSRHIDELQLYANTASSPDMSALIRQLSNDAEKGSSLGYITEADHAMHKHNAQAMSNMGRLDKMMLKSYDFIADNITKLADKYLPKSEYYHYQEPKEQLASVSEVMDRTYQQNQHKHVATLSDAQQLVVGGNELKLDNKSDNPDHRINNIVIGDSRAESSHYTNNNELSASIMHNASIENVKQPAKSKFYANANHIRGKKQSALEREQLKAKWDNEAQSLRTEMSFKAEQIARDLLGDPNKHLSNGRELRFGIKGGIAVCISGEKAGTWFDFSKGAGGDLFDLTREVRGGEFKDAAEYLRSSVGMSTSTNIRAQLQLVHDHANSDSTNEYIQDKELKTKYANKLYNKSKSFNIHSVANRYLQDHRAISCDLSQDIKTTDIYDKQARLLRPALIAFARNKDGNITGGQHIVLDKKTGGKADISVPKKSFGNISGSFVALGSNMIADADTTRDNNARNSAKITITIIAEGIETGLSVKQALREHSNKHTYTKILCSLGISNIKNYQPRQGEKIIIAADNDIKVGGKAAITSKVIANAKLTLEAKGAFVKIVKPEKQGDFNDMLKDKSQGEQAIQSAFNSALSRHTATTLLAYFAHDDKGQLSSDERTKIKYLAQFNIDERQIVDAYRAGGNIGQTELAKAIKPIAHAHACVKENMRVIDSANVFGANINNKQLTLSLIGKTSEEIDKYIIDTREQHYFRYNLDLLSADRKTAKGSAQALSTLKAEQDFLAKLHNNYAPNIHSKQLIKDINNAYHSQENNVFAKLEKLSIRIEKTEIKKDSIVSIVKNSPNSAVAFGALTKKYHSYVMHNIHSCLKDINSGMTIRSARQSFNCPIKLLDHLLDQHKNNEFFPQENVHKIHNDLTRQNQLLHSFNGPIL